VPESATRNRVQRGRQDDEEGRQLGSPTRTVCSVGIARSRVDDDCLTASLVMVAPTSAVAVGTQTQTIQFAPPYDGVVGESLPSMPLLPQGWDQFSLAATAACTISEDR